MMKRFFGQDSNLFKLLQMLMYLAMMNVLFILTSIPVVTIGAAYTALLACIFDLLMDEGEFSARFLLKKFRESWKSASLLGTIGLIVLGILAHHIVLFFLSDSPMRLFMLGLYIALFIWVFGVLIFQFAMIARCGHWEKEMLRNGALMVLAKFPVFIVALLLTASPLTLFMMPASVLISMLPIVVLFWISCPAMACGWMMKRVLEPVYPQLFQKREVD